MRLEPCQPAPPAPAHPKCVLMRRYQAHKIPKNAQVVAHQPVLTLQPHQARKCMPVFWVRVRVSPRSPGAHVGAGVQPCGVHHAQVVARQPVRSLGFRLCQPRLTRRACGCRCSATRGPPRAGSIAPASAGLGFRICQPRLTRRACGCRCSATRGPPRAGSSAPAGALCRTGRCTRA